MIVSKSNDKRRSKMNERFEKCYRRIGNKYDDYSLEELERAKIELEIRNNEPKRLRERLAFYLTIITITIAIMTALFTFFTYDPKVDNQIKTDDLVIKYLNNNYVGFQGKSSNSLVSDVIFIEPNPDKDNKKLAEIFSYYTIVLLFVAFLIYCEYLFKSSSITLLQNKLELDKVISLIKHKRALLKHRDFDINICKKYKAIRLKVANKNY